MLGFELTTQMGIPDTVPKALSFAAKDNTISLVVSQAASHVASQLIILYFII